MSVRLIDCDAARHAPPILEIFNEAIVHSTAIYDYRPRSLEDMHAWFADKREHGHPVIGLEGEDAALLGFATWGVFRARPAYKYTVEHSVYVHHEHRRRGHGETLMRALVERAMEHQLHVLVGGIDAANQPSIDLHLKLGFRHVGTLPQTGFKFGRWLDLAFYQLTLPTPEHPVDG